MDFKIILMLRKMISNPTIIIIVNTLISLQITAASGAAVSPPVISPM